MMKRNHHLQPDFYLKGFCSNSEGGNPKIWVYEKGKPFYDGKTEQLQNPKHLTTKKAARKRDFYAFVKDDGTKEFEKYENILRDDFEEPAKPILEKIKRFEEINTNEKAILSKYIASMRLRGNWGKQITDLSFDLAVEEQLKSSNLPESEIGIYKKWVENVKFRRELSHESIIIKSPYFASFLDKMNWVFYVANKIKYFTSDNPVSVNNMLSKEGCLMFPISSNLTLYASWQRGKDLVYKESTDNVVMDFRKTIAKESLNEVYYSEKAEWLVEFLNKK